MRRSVSGELEDLSAHLRPMGAFRALSAVAVALMLFSACRAQLAAPPVVSADESSVFSEGCDAGLCWTEGRDASGRLLSRREQNGDGSTTWVYEPPGTLERLHEVRILRAANPRRLWVRNTWLGAGRSPDRRETYDWDESATTVVAHVEEGSFREGRWRVVADETRPRNVK